MGKLSNIFKPLHMLESTYCTIEAATPKYLAQGCTCVLGWIQTWHYMRLKLFHVSS